MADIQSNIKVNFDTAEALNNLKSLQRQISAFHTSMAKGSAANAQAAANLQKDLINNINATGKFAASLTNVRTTTESFTNSLEKNKFSMGEYFKFAAGSTKTFGRVFSKEFSIIEKVARERVKDIQSQYISMGRDANGALKAIKIRPLVLDLEDFSTKTQIAAQRHQIFNQLIKQGSTNLLNWGKNTQWAGRQLMVGFTVPLSIFGAKAAQTFMQMEKQVIQFKRVYGELGTTQEATDAMAKQIQQLATEFTKYGVTVEQTMALAAQAAATGKTGADLMAQVTEATRLAVLGNIDQSQSLETTIALSNAFGTAAEDLAGKINFLNAVENQTVTSIDDLTIAIPKAGPVIQQLGGSVEDLAFFLTAMKEGGINASEGANALKSGLASLINPTDKAKEMLGGMGINIQELVNNNQGDVKGLVQDFGALLDVLTPLQRAQAIEQLFGKFQFSRLSTLFQNVNAQGTQAQRVLELTTASAQELAALSGKELNNISETATFKFEKAMADFKAAIAPVGEEFLKAITPIIEFGTKIIKEFNKMDDGAKQFITNITLLFAGLGPALLMTVGLVGNGIANLMKGFAAVGGVFARLKGVPTAIANETGYLTQEQIESHAIASSLDQIHAQLRQTFTSEAGALDLLTAAYERNIAAQRKYAAPPAAGRGKTKKYADGVVMVPGPKGAGDIVPAMLSPGEAVIPADMAQQYAPLIQGMIAGNIPGYAQGTVSVGRKAMAIDVKSSSVITSVNGVIEQVVSRLANGSSIMEEVLTRLAGQTKVTLGDFMREVEVVSTSIGNAAGEATKAAGREYKLKASGAGKKGTVGQNLESARGPMGAEEFARAQASSEAGQKAMADYYESIGASGERVANAIKQAGDIHRAHIVEISGVEKQFLEGWSEEFWVAQASFENQMSNALNISDRTKTLYLDQLENLQDEAVSSEQKRELARKINANLALTEDELQIQAKVLQNMLADSQIMSQTSANFGPLAAANVAGAQARASMGPASPGVGTRTAAEIASQRQILTAAVYKNNPSGSASGSFAPTSEAGKAIYKQVSTDIADAVNDASRAQSPSKETFDAGKNMADGAKEGILSGKDDAFNAGKQIADSIVSGSTGGKKPRKGSAKTTTDTGKTTTVIPMAVPKGGTSETDREDRKTAGTVKETGSRLSVVNDRIQQVSFALTSLAGVGIMAGGEIGNVSGIIFQLSGALYGLMAVTELLTSTKLLEVAAGRAKAATDALNAATGVAAGTKLFQSFGKVGTGVSGFFKTIGSNIKIFGANILRLGGFIVRFLGPIGLAIGAITALVGIVNLINEAKERERVKIEGLGDAAQITADKLTLMEGLLNETATVTPMEAAKNAKTAPAGLEAATAEQRTRVETIKSDPGFQDAYKGSIEQLRGATDSAAKAVLQSLAINMKGKGFTDQAIQDWLMALRESAGKLNIEITPESISLNDAAARKAATDSIDKLGKDFSKAIASNPDFGKATQVAVTSGNMVVGYVTKINEEMTDDAKQKLHTFTSSIQSTMNGISGMLQNGSISTDAFKESFASMSQTILAMPNPSAQMFVLNDLLSQSLNPELANQATQLTSVNDKMLLLQAAAAGVTNISPALITALQNETRSQWDAVQAANARLEIQRQLNNALAGYAGVNAASTTAAPTTTKYSGGSTKQTTLSPFQKAVEDLKEQRKELVYANKAYNKLRNAGFDIADAFELAKDPIIAAALATTKVGTKQWKELIKLIKETDKLSKLQNLRNTIREMKGLNKIKSDFAAIIPQLVDLGYNADQIGQILSDPDIAKQLAKELKDGKLDTQEMYEYLKGIQAMKDIQIQIDLSTPEGMEDAVNQAFSDIQAAFDAKEAVINLDFQMGTNESGENSTLINIGKLEDAIKAAQQEIDGYNVQIDDMEASLYWMEQQEEKINETFDARLEALDKIEEVNNRISEQQQAQLSVADAITSGDIAAAAKAMYEYRQQQAQARVEDQRSMLESAREKALGNLRDKNGKSRKQIEADILDLKNRIYIIEENTLEPAQQALDKAIAIRDAAIQSLEYLGQNRNEWSAVQAGVNLAKVEAEGYKKAIEDALLLIPKLKEAWDNVGTGDLNGITTSPTTTKTTTTTKSGSGTGTTAAPKTVNPAWTAQNKIVSGLQTNLDRLKAQAAEVSKTIISLQNQIKALTGVAGMTSVVNSLKTTLAGKQTEGSYLAQSIAMVSSDLSKAKTKLASIPQYLNKGGIVKPRYMNMGGLARSLARGADTVPAMLTPGEFVVKKYAVEKFGLDNLKAINNGTYTGGSVYNSYEINVTAKTDANVSDIARTVVNEIKRIDSQRIRGNRL